MSIWENIPLCKRESITKSLSKFNRVWTRKQKIKRLCQLQEVGVKMDGNIEKKI